MVCKYFMLRWIQFLERSAKNKLLFQLFDFVSSKIMLQEMSLMSNIYFFRKLRCPTDIYRKVFMWHEPKQAHQAIVRSFSGSFCICGAHWTMRPKSPSHPKPFPFWVYPCNCDELRPSNSSVKLVKNLKYIKMYWIKDCDVMFLVKSRQKKLHGQKSSAEKFFFSKRCLISRERYKMNWPIIRWKFRLPGLSFLNCYIDPWNTW